MISFNGVDHDMSFGVWNGVYNDVWEDPSN